MSFPSGPMSECGWALARCAVVLCVIGSLIYLSWPREYISLSIMLSDTSCEREYAVGWPMVSRCRTSPAVNRAGGVGSGRTSTSAVVLVVCCNASHIAAVFVGSCVSCVRWRCLWKWSVGGSVIACVSVAVWIAVLCGAAEIMAAPFQDAVERLQEVPRAVSLGAVIGHAMVVNAIAAIVGNRLVNNEPRVSTT